MLISTVEIIFIIVITIVIAFVFAVVIAIADARLRFVRINLFNFMLRYQLRK